MKLPKGKYWIGDPCYVLADNNSKIDFDWEKFCNYTFEGDPSGRRNEGVIDHQGIRFAFHGTAYGDGSYFDQKGNEYGVDAGMIGCVPYDVVAPHVDKEWMERTGTVHEFKKDFDSTYDNGTITFGNIVINTGDDEDEEEWEEEWEEDYA